MPYVGPVISSEERALVQSQSRHDVLDRANYVAWTERLVRNIGMPSVSVTATQTGGALQATVRVIVIREGTDDIEIDRFVVPGLGLATTRHYHTASRAVAIDIIGANDVVVDTYLSVSAGGGA